jgi:hypothetical protein
VQRQNSASSRFMIVSLHLLRPLTAAEDLGKQLRHWDCSPGRIGPGERTRREPFVTREEWIAARSAWRSSLVFFGIGGHPGDYARVAPQL